MSKDKGIFEPKEGFASEKPSGNPFDFGGKQESNPFSSGPAQRSPFASNEESTPPPPAPGGFASAIGSSPFGESSASGDPFEDGPDQDDGPFAVVGEETESKPVGGPPPLGGSTPPSVGPPETPASPVVAEEKPVASAPASASSPAPAAGDPFGSDSSSIRQLELRAIFGVDRELSEGEMLDRAKGLPGIRELARVQDSEAGALDALKRLVGSLNFGGGAVRLTCGGSPIEFIREGSTVLAVQNDGSFAPGVRETLMIVARELSRM